MAISLVQVAGKITAQLMNQVISAVNQIALAGIVPASVQNGSVTGNGKITFANQGGVSINGIFSGSYDNYRIVINISTRSAASSVNVHMRAAGSDYAGTGYAWVRGIDSGTGRVTTSATSGTAAPIDNGTTAGQTLDGYLDVFGPALGTYTAAAGIVSGNSSGTISSTVTSWNCQQAQAFDGVSIYPISGTFTGTIRVYGYNNLT